ncbi:baseplate complex protein, partial [Serratia ureilytica]
MTIVTLALNGEAIALKGLMVTPMMQFQDKDQSGQTSSTANAEQGIKPKELRISGMIPFSEAKVLTRLFALAEATEGGKLKRYRVANHTAQAINFRLATFTGSIDAPKQDG